MAVWHGNYYAWELECHLGLAPHGAVRAGFVHYNSREDAERLVSAVAVSSRGGGAARLSRRRAPAARRRASGGSGTRSARRSTKATKKPPALVPSVMK